VPTAAATVTTPTKRVVQRRQKYFWTILSSCDAAESHTAGELEALDPPLAGHLDYAEGDQITPFPIHDQHDPHTQNRKNPALDRFLTKSPQKSTIMAKARLEKG